MKKQFKNKLGFTLAEVLITLAIIGVVAALTLPGLISNYQKTQYVTGLKKVYAELSQAFKLYMADEGVTDLSQTPLFNSYWDNAVLSNILKKYFKVIKACTQSSDNSCQITESYLMKAYVPFGGFNTYSVIVETADGMTFGFIPTTLNECKPDDNIQSNMKGKCILVRVDINGSTPPNKEGRDYFVLDIGPDGNIYPGGSRESAQYNQYKATGSIDGWESSSSYWKNSEAGCGNDINGITYAYGWQCSARIRDEGWQMTY